MQRGFRNETDHPGCSKRDYFPWLVGVLAAATTALAIGIALVHRSIDTQLAATIPAVASDIEPTAPPAATPRFRTANAVDGYGASLMGAQLVRPCMTQS